VTGSRLCFWTIFPLSATVLFLTFLRHSFPLRKGRCLHGLGRYFEGIDCAIHLAAITDAPASFERKEEVERVNCEGTKMVAEACRSSGCKLVFISTTSVYGSQKEIVDEDCSDDELKAQSPYAESKLRAERMI